MKVSDTDHRTNGEAADATEGGKFVYGFSEDPGTEDALVAFCGGKGAGLMRMRQLGLPVPEGFVITTEACAGYLRSGRGEQGIFGEFLLNAQGEDVVAGIRTPRPLREMERDLPNAYRQFLEAAERLERENQDMQDVEFTVERDTLYMLQTRSGKRTGLAALKITRDMAEEGLISREEAIIRVEPRALEQLLHPRVNPEADLEGETFSAGDVLTIDGADGSVIRGDVPLVEPEMNEDFETLFQWADEARTLGVRANADTPEDARRARELGAEGIELCRTEHMFMDGERLQIMREDDSSLRRTRP